MDRIEREGVRARADPAHDVTSAIADRVASPLNSGAGSGIAVVGPARKVAEHDLLRRTRLREGSGRRKEPSPSGESTATRPPSRRCGIRP
jgi:hypothetical protein